MVIAKDRKKAIRKLTIDTIPGTKGCVIDAPAESEYAVLPVGELIIIPSALTVVIFARQITKLNEK